MGHIIFFLILFLTFRAEGATNPSETIEKRILKLKNYRLEVEIADTPEKQERGLMFRKLNPNEGMLFLYKGERELTFWMKNTVIPLSIGFFDSKGNLIYRTDMYPEEKGKSDSELKRYASPSKARMALEVPLGWFQKNGIEIGDRLEGLSF